MGAPRAIALCQCFNGALQFQAGYWHAAETSLHESIQLYRELGAASGEALSWQRLGVLQTARGELDAAMNSFSEGMIAAEGAVMRAHCQARLCASMTRNRLHAGDLPAAEQALALGLEMSKRHGNCATCDALLLPVAISLYLAQDEMTQAEEFCRQLEDAAAQYASRIWVAMARQSRAEVVAAQNKLEEALGHYEEAHQAFKSAEFDYEAARCLLAMAELRTSRSTPHDDRLATSIRNQAQAVFERLGAS
jgi:tetratricopeptide (TPR) repeat protein